MNTEAKPRRTPASRRPKSRDPEATREEIIVAATREFSEKGIHGARVDEIAARTATSKHMIYYYFGSKDGLYAAVLERAYTDFRKVEQNIDYAALDPVEALRTLIGNTFDVHVRNPHLIRVFMSENLDQGRHVMTIDHSGQRELVMNTVRAILVRGAAQGILRDDMDPLHFHHSVSALSFYAVSNRFTFGAVFGIDPASADWLAARRSEVIETMLARCRNHG